MKKSALIFISFLFSVYSYSQDIIFLHTNDMHSHLNGFSPELEYTPLKSDNDPTLGGFSRIAGLIEQERKANEGKVIVADAGDFLMGTLFQSIELEEGFQLQLMKKMGYNYAAIGNHEFDFGANNLAQIIRNAKNNGEIPQLLCANYKPSLKENDLELLELFNNGTLLPFAITEKNGFKIGIFALVGIDAEESIPIDYHVQFENIYKTARKTARYLKNKEKVDLVVLLSHSGVVIDKNGFWSGEDVFIAQKSKDIDLILSGHTHTNISSPIYVNNTLIVQTGALGTAVGKVEIFFNENAPPYFRYNLIPINDDIIANKEIQELIDEKSRLIDNNLLLPFNIKQKDPIFETSFNLVCDEWDKENSNLGPIIAQSIYQYINTHTEEGVDISLVATGVVRSGFYTGNHYLQSVNDVFNVMPLGKGNDNMPGFPLGRIYLYGHEIKKALELVNIMATNNPSYYLYYAGARLKVDPTKGLFKKIQAIEINTNDEWIAVNFDRNDKTLYAIGANQYMLAAIGLMKKKSFGIVNVIPKDYKGNEIDFEQMAIDFSPEKEGIQEGKEWIALLELLQNQQDLNSNKIPDAPEYFNTIRNPIEIVHSVKNN